MSRTYTWFYVYKKILGKVLAKPANTDLSLVESPEMSPLSKEDSFMTEGYFDLTSNEISISADPYPKVGTGVRGKRFVKNNSPA